MRRLALFALALSACRAAPSEAPVSAPDSVAMPIAAADSATDVPADTSSARVFDGTAGPTERPAAPAAGVARLENVRTGTHAGYDRITFAFAGEALPGYRIAYTDALQTCGEGRAVDLGTAAMLQVRFQPAAAHTEAGAPTLTARDVAYGLPVLTRGLRTCDFEAEVTWALGLAARVPYRVLELRAPTRLVIDVQHSAR